MKLYLKIDDTKKEVSTVWSFNKKLIQVHTTSLVDLTFSNFMFNTNVT